MWCGTNIDDMPPNSIATSGEALRSLREGAGITARELAAAVGVSHSTIVRFEAGTREVADRTRERVIVALAQLASAKASAKAQGRAS